MRKRPFFGSYFAAAARDLGPNLSNRYCHNRLLMAVSKVPVTQVRTEVGLSLAQMSAGPSPAATVDRMSDGWVS